MDKVQCMYSLKRCRQVHTCECTFPRPRGTRQPDSKCDVGLAPCRGLLAAVRHERGDEVAGLGAGPRPARLHQRDAPGCRGEVRHATRDTRCVCCDGDPPSAARSPLQMPATSCCVLASMEGEEGERPLQPTLTKRHRLQAGRCFTSSSCNLAGLSRKFSNMFSAQGIKTLPLTQCLMFNVRACLW